MSIDNEDGHFQNVLQIKLNALRTSSLALQVRNFKYIAPKSSQIVNCGICT